VETKTQRHGGTEKLVFFKEELTNRIIASAIEVHRNLGPGLLESAYSPRRIVFYKMYYFNGLIIILEKIFKAIFNCIQRGEECFCHELYLQGLPFERQKPLPVEYKGINLDCGYRMDVVIDNKVVVELKCVDRITPVHEAQLLTYLRLSHIKVGLILNFYTQVLKDGIKRLVL